MSTEELIKRHKTYFGASNGYKGFKSHFDEIFSPLSFEHIFILKGGPGTGKSSLMKKVTAHFEADCQIEIILCSSDPSSLDGVIISKNAKKVAILDGTAPHTTDPKLPIVVEEIINLAEALDCEKMKKERNKIALLNERKAFHYKNAYAILSIIERVHEHQKRTAPKHNVAVFKRKIKDLISQINTKICGRNHRELCVSSFSRAGYTQLSHLNFNQRKTILLLAEEKTASDFLNDLIKEFTHTGIDYLRFTSPFSETVSEGVLFSDILVYRPVLQDLASKDGCEVMDLRDADALQLPIYSYLSQEKEDLLFKAKEELYLASLSHFELEKIYTKNIDFSLVNKKTEDIIAKINKIFTL